MEGFLLGCFFGYTQWHSKVSNPPNRSARKLKNMNVVPKEFIRVMPDAMQAFVSEAFQKAGDLRRRRCAHRAPVSPHGSARRVQSRHTTNAGIRRDDA